MGKGRLKQALELAGSEHRYQNCLLILLSVLWIVRVGVVLCGPYIYMDPQFHCISKGTHIVHEKEACKIIDQCAIIDDFTLTAELKLYCHSQWARLTIQSIFPIGSFIGLMVVNLISDTRGRRTAVMLDLVITVVGAMFALIGGNSHNIYCLIISQFLFGFGGYSVLTLGYTILSDFFSDYYRQVGIVVISAMAGLAVFTIGIFYLMKFYWLYFILYFLFIPLLVITAAFYFFLHESPFVLMNHNEQDAAQLILIKIAVFNGRRQNIPQMKQIIEEQERDHTHKPSLHKIYHMVKEWRFLKPIIILIVINGIGNLNYFGITYSFAQQGLGFGYNSMIFGFVQLISFVVTRFTVKNIPRKQGMSIFYLLVMVILMTFASTYVQESTIISSIFFGLNRILAVNAYCLIVCMQTQAFSVYIQSTAAGLIQGFALYGAFFAPLIVQAANYLQIDPLVLIGFFVSFAVWPQYFLQQTFQTPAILDEPKSSTISLINMSREQIQRGTSQVTLQRKLSRQMRQIQKLSIKISERQVSTHLTK